LCIKVEEILEIILDLPPEKQLKISNAILDNPKMKEKLNRILLSQEIDPVKTLEEVRKGLKRSLD